MFVVGGPVVLGPPRGDEVVEQPAELALEVDVTIRPPDEPSAPSGASRAHTRRRGR